MGKNPVVYIIIILLFVTACKQDNSTKRNQPLVQEESDRILSRAEEQKSFDFSRHIDSVRASFAPQSKSTFSPLSKSEIAAREEYIKRLQAVTKHDLNLRKSFYRLPNSSLSSEIPLRQKYVYPDYYGGHYIDSTRLIVWVVRGTDTPEVRNDLIRRIESKDFQMVPADYSYNTLIKTLDTLENNIIENKKYPLIKQLAVGGRFISNSENRIVVLMNNCSSYKIKLFNDSLLSSPSVIIRENDQFDAAQ